MSRQLRQEAGHVVARVAIAALVLAGCVAPLPHATADDAVRARARWPATTVASLEAGRRLFAFRCSACHGLLLPARYPVEQWPKILDTMQAEAKLSPEERASIEQFVLTIATRPPDGGAARE